MGVDEEGTEEDEVEGCGPLDSIAAFGWSWAGSAIIENSRLSSNWSLKRKCFASTQRKEHREIGQVKLPMSNRDI